jgi:hypothetical protein
VGKCDIRFHGYDARSNRGLIRWELFLHRDVRDVVFTSRSDTLCVVYRGEPDPSAWALALREAGFPAPEVLLLTRGAISEDPRNAAA